MRRDTGLRILVVGATAVLALAANHFFFHWALLGEATVRRILFL
jgi:hypothetical protein